MKKFITCICLLACGVVLRAQDRKVDTLSLQPEIKRHLICPTFPGIKTPSLLSPDAPHFETAAEKAAKINARTFDSVMSSVDKNLAWYRLPKFTPAQKNLFFLLGLFLSAPPRLPTPGNFQNPPGMAPADNPYSPDRIPQLITSEYDFATGTYKPVMVSPEEFQKRLSDSSLK